jgi:hypothetical protein
LISTPNVSIGNINFSLNQGSWDAVPAEQKTESQVAVKVTVGVAQAAATDSTCTIGWPTSHFLILQSPAEL